MKNMRPLLSKSTFMYGIQCEKRLFLHKFHKDLANPEDEQEQAIFQTGTNVGELAQSLFPNGVNAQGDEEWHSQITVKRTQELMLTHSVIYEAAFIFNEVLCAVDILVKQDDLFHAYEVKSTTKVKPQHLEDAALQYHVLTNNGIKLADFSIVHLNTKYVKIGDIAINQLFTKTSVWKDITKKQHFVNENIGKLKQILQSGIMPTKEMGKHCTTPYGCNFSEYCLTQIPVIENTADVIELDKTIHINKSLWKDFTNQIVYPIYYFDFETIMYSVPEFDYSRPYQQIPFQYSLHIQRKKGSKREHHEYLGDGENDPREKLVLQMLQDLGTTGTIIAWNISFEQSRIKELMMDYPQFETPLSKIKSRFLDLMNQFRPNRKIITSEAFNSSYSIKKVLPIAVPELSYGDLEIQEGGTASFLYGQMKSLSPIAQNKLKKDLLAYCNLDTLAMVKIYENINNLIK